MDQIGMDRLHEIARAVAANLGDDWTYVFQAEGAFNPRYPVIRHTDGREICLSNSWPHGRLHVYGSLSNEQRRFMRYSEKLPSSNLNPNKSAALIARDIERRILPGYTLIYEDTKAALAHHIQHNRVTEENAGLVGDWLGAMHQRYDHSSPSFRPVLIGGDFQHGRFEVHGDTVEVTLTGLTLQQVQQLSALTTTWPERD